MQLLTTKEKSRTYYVFLVGISLVLIVSHFLPPERAAISPDDFAYLSKVRLIGSFDFLSYFEKYADRPIQEITDDLRSKYADDNPKTGFALVFFSSLLVQVLVFVLLKTLLGDSFLAFAGSLIYCLLPNKLETYHTPIISNISMVTAVYILSLLFFIRFTRDNAYIYLAASLVLYIVGLFWYESGFFMPVAMAAYCYLYEKKNGMKYISGFVIFSVFYATYRLTGIFGLVPTDNIPRHIRLSVIPLNILDMFHSYAGRYMIRSVLYGFYNYVFIEQPWLIVISIANIVLWAFLASLFKKNEMTKIDGRSLVFALVLLTLFLVPNLLNDSGGISGRALLLPSIGVAIVSVWLLGKTGNLWRRVLMVFIIAAMIISQGNAWAQVVACRLNAAVYETMKEKKAEIVKADNVVIDTRSFADSIPFTWINRDFNVLNIYYGAQAFEVRGLSSMIRLVTGDYKKQIYTATERPSLSGGILRVVVSRQTGYRSVAKEAVDLPAAGAFVIDYRMVFGDNFNNGKRIKRY
jgi:hypothetical protein